MLKQITKNLIDTLIEIICRFSPKTKNDSKKVLIFRKDGLGDYLVFYPVLKFFRQYYRDYKISLVLPKIAEGLRPLLSDFDEIIEFDAKSFSSNLSYRYQLTKKITLGNFAVAIYPVFTREPIGDHLIGLTRAKERIGIYNKNLPSKNYTKLITIPDNMISEIKRNVYFAEQCTGETIKIDFPTININLFDNKKAEEIKKIYKLQSQQYAIIFTGTGAFYKKWPEERFAVVCDYLSNKGFTPVVCGGPNDIVSAELIIKNAKHKDKIVNLAGKIDIPTLGHLLNTSLFYLGNDTGPMHLSAALKVPTIGIVGSGDIRRFFPYDDEDRNVAIYNLEATCKDDNWACCKDLKPGEWAPCIAGIKVETVISSVEKILEKYEK
ncbi:MAG: glycosyltransferase family 9 protein [Candidatus Paceibacterota bacterium]